MRVCVLGNSHAGSLKQGWDSMRHSFPDLSLTFFASRSDTLRGLFVTQEGITADDSVLSESIRHTSGGIDCIKACDYDAYLVYGLQLALPQSKDLLSSAVISALLRDVWRNSLNYKICMLVKSMTASPVFAGLNPQIASLSSVQPQRSAFNYADLGRFLGRTTESDGVHLHLQPAETLSNKWNTNVIFSSGSARLDVGDDLSNLNHPISDVRHMNANFGRRYLESFLPILLS